MRLIVYGVGAIGGSVAAQMHRAGLDVVGIARGAQLEAIRRAGLRLETPAQTVQVDLAVVGHPREITFKDDDVVLLAVKSHHTSTVLAELRAIADTSLPVICMQNGVANEPAALRWFDNVYGVVVMLPATFMDPGVVLAHCAPITGILDVGRWPRGTDAITNRLTKAFCAATFDSLELEDVTRWKYAKLLMNLGNVVEALCGPKARGFEITEVARAEGRRCLEAANIDYASDAEDRARRGNLLTIASAGGRPRPGGSSWQSLARGAGSIETDYLNGEIVLLGRLHGIPTPVNAALQRAANMAVRTNLPAGALDAEALIADGQSSPRAG
jgi:2-dehydropantoate 2-reductase